MIVLVSHGRPRLRTPMVMLVTMIMPVLMFVLVTFLFPIDFSWQFLLPMHQHVDLCCRNSAAIHARDFQLCADIECRYRFLEYLRRDTGIEQRTQKHVAADSRKAIQISDAHCD